MNGDPYNSNYVAVTQCTLILNHIKREGSITSRQGSRLYGCDRTAARIYDLNLKGHDIQREMIRVRGRNGPARVARYFL